MFLVPQAAISPSRLFQAACFAMWRVQTTTGSAARKTQCMGSSSGPGSGSSITHGSHWQLQLRASSTRRAEQASLQLRPGSQRG